MPVQVGVRRFVLAGVALQAAKPKAVAAIVAPYLRHEPARLSASLIVLPRLPLRVRRALAG